jgi:predicted dehydrogenase
VEALVPEGVVRVGTRARGEVREIDARVDERVQYEGFHLGASYLEVAAFCDAVRSGAPPSVTVDDGYWSVAMGVAAHRSIETGTAVAVG